MRSRQPAHLPDILTPRDQRLDLRDHLAQRLADGDARITDAEHQGIDVRTWEDFWLKLLAEYVEVCDSLTLDEAA